MGPRVPLVPYPFGVYMFCLLLLFFLFLCVFTLYFVILLVLVNKALIKIYINTFPLTAVYLK